MLKRLSEFSVVDGVVTAEPNALEAYFAAHPEAAKFKNRLLTWEEELTKLFAGRLATGADVMGIDELISSTIESSPTPGPSRSVSRAPSILSAAAPIRSKRSATSSIAAPDRKKVATADRVARQISAVADRLTDLNSVLALDY